MWSRLAIMVQPTMALIVRSQFNWNMNGKAKKGMTEKLNNVFGGCDA